MKYFFATLALGTAVFGGNIPHPFVEESQKREVVVSQNARVFSQEDQFFPARYFYPTYPEYADSRYVVPTPPSEQISSWSSAWTKMIPITSFALLYASGRHLLFSLLLILIVGFVFTTAICTFTPICIIAFPAFALTKNQVKQQVAELARNYITPESLTAATIFVQNAVDKYAVNFQTKEDEKENTTGEPTSTIKPSSSTQSLS